MAPRLLLLEDSDDDALLLRIFLERELPQSNIEWVTTLQDFEASLKTGIFDVVISDYQLDGFTGLDAFRVMLRSSPDIPFIMVSGCMGEDLVVSALKSGISDYVTKSSLTRLPMAILREVEAAQLKRQKSAGEVILQQNRQNLIALIENTDDGIWSVNRNMQVTILNASAKRFFKDIYGAELYVGAYFPDVFPTAVHSLWDHILKSAFSGLKSHQELTFQHTDGTDCIMDVSVNPISDDQNAITGVSFFAKDITARKKTELSAAANLKEKEIMLSEIHHRVKNNLAIVSGILMLQQDKMDDVANKTIYGEAINKIKSIALIHEKLYQNKSLAEIQFNDYIDSLAETVRGSMGDDKTISVDVDADPMIMDVTTAIPCGLILSELLTNAYKHAFKHQDSGRIVVRLRKKPGGFTLSVSDDGRAPDVLKQLKNSNSVGMMIVHGLVEQLNANLHFDCANGTTILIDK